MLKVKKEGEKKKTVRFEEPNVKKVRVKNEYFLSHRELVTWANNVVSNSRTRRIEDLCSGVVYCKIINQIAPNFLSMIKIKVNATKPLDMIYNLELLQAALQKMKSQKVCEKVMHCHCNQ